MSTGGLATHQHDPTIVLMGSGPLGAAGGVVVLGGMPGPPWIEALAREAAEMESVAERTCAPSITAGPPRSRTPGRALASAPGGPVQDAFYASPDLHDFIAHEVGVPVAPSGNRGSYSYYTQPGDHLALHVDVDGCDVTLITVLQDDADPRSAGGGVAVYRSAIGAELEAIDDATPASIVKARPGDSILILGGLVPHRVLPLESASSRVISPLCFRAQLPR